MLKDAKVDLVYICTTNTLHYDQIKLCLAYGKHVICEKPIAITKDEFNSLMELPQIEKVALVFQNRLNFCVCTSNTQL